MAVDNLIIGGGFAGRITAHTLQKRGCECLLLFDETDEMTPIDGGHYNKIYGGLTNWGGQLFIDFEHKIFRRYEEEIVLQILFDFLDHHNAMYKLTYLEQGLHITLPKNWKPLNISYDQKKERVHEINFSDNYIMTSDQKKISYKRLYVCTGSQVKFQKVSRSSFKLSPTKSKDKYDKHLTFVDNIKNQENIVDIRETTDNFLHYYPLMSNIDYSKNKNSILKLMHYLNKQISITELSIIDFFTGFLIRTKKKHSDYPGGFMLTTSPKSMFQEDFNVQKMINNGNKYHQALHHQTYPDVELMKMCALHGVSIDSAQSEHAIFKSGSVGYRALNIMAGLLDA